MSQMDTTEAPGGLFAEDVTEPSWRDLWKGMPEYNHEDQEPWQTLTVHFRSPEDRREFFKLIGQRMTANPKCIWYPEAQIGRFADKMYKSDSPRLPRYPIYIISKGRWETRKTSRALEKIGVPYHIVVEPQEYEQYAAVIDPAKILTLPFSNLGQGSIPARNWVWEHAITTGAARHWILDDNIGGFFRFQHNLKCPADASVFCAAEDFTDRFENVAMSGMNYFMFVTRKAGDVPPFYLNTRVYSCILLRNDLPHRWRGRYNEDTDLSIRFLKDGFCTILFNAFLADKEQTMKMKGGNSDELYKGDGRLKMAESLRDQHPEIVTITEKWGRFQHQVDYRFFRRNKLVPKPGLVIPNAPNNYGMKLHTVAAPAPAETPASAESAPENKVIVSAASDMSAAALESGAMFEEIDAPENGTNDE